MTIRFDDAAKAVALSVRDLAEAGGPRGHLTLDVVQRSTTRAAMGRHAHTDWQQLQAERDAGYRAEVRLVHTVVVHGWTVTLHGRVDGLTDVEGHIVVEEIKSTAWTAERLHPTTAADWPSYVQQLEVYLWMLHEAKHPSPVGRLVLVSLHDGSQHVLGVPLAAAEVGARILDALEALVTGRERRLRWLAQRRGAVVPLPHARWRPGQAEAYDAVLRGLAERRQTLIEAPTGMGKTAAVLTAALAHAMANDQQVFWASARNTQQEVPLDVLRRLRSAGLPLRAVRLRAREKSCLNDVVACRPDRCRFAEGYHDKVRAHRLLEALATEGVLEPERLADVGRTHTVCPAELALDLTEHVDVVVGDVNYVFDPGATLRRAFADGAAGWVVVVDEAHQLVERSRGWLSPRLDITTTQDAEAQLTQGGELYRPFVSLARRIGDWIAAAVDRAGLPDRDERVRTRLDGASLDRLADEVDALGLDYAWLKAERPVATTDADDRWLALARQVLRVAARAADAGDETVPVAGTRPGAEFVQLLCLDASGWLGPRVAALGGFIACSATLSPTPFYRDLLGLDPQQVSTTTVPPVFPPERRPVFVLPRVSTRYEDRAAHAPRTAELITACVDAVPGNVAVYFSSFVFLDDIQQRLQPRRHQVRAQRPNMDDDARRALLATLSDGEPSLLCAVLGGVFAEGIDLPPGALDAVIVVGPALPPVGLERDLLRSWYQTRYDDGHRYASLIPGMTRVVQAAGRLIRRPEDRGVVLLMDRRFRWRDIQELLPRDWLVEIPEDPIAALEAFFAAPPPGASLP